MKKYLDNSLTFEERAKALREELTLEEKIHFLYSENPEIKRLNIPKYDWWNEGLHGLARSGIATVFPQSIAMAATWDRDLMREVADTESNEFRAKYNAHSKMGHVDKYFNTSALSPNINIFRDPRWGRGHETYGECPTLTGEMGKNFVLGMQGSGKYIKTACCAKHYAVHSGPEAIRNSFNATPSEKDLYETYLPAFETLVKEAKVENVMSAYNAVNGVPMSANKRLLTDILRDEMGFNGSTISDACAVEDVYDKHNYVDEKEKVPSVCLKGGLDIDLVLFDNYYALIKDALDKGYLSEDIIDTSCERVLASRLRMGLFAENLEYDNIPYDIIACDDHKELSEKAATESIVMLKNDGILPLNPKDYKHILVVGPNANNYEVNYGNYAGTSDSMVSVLDGIRNYDKNIKVTWTLGTTINGMNYSSCADSYDFGFYEAEIMAENADLIVYVGGLNAELEGENGDATNSQAGGDRLSLELPGYQNQLIDKLASLGKPLIVVNIAGGPVALNNSQEKANAILSGLYLGERAGNAVAKVLFGDFSPCGKLPYTVPYSSDDLPDIKDYSMVGRTYRYMEKEPLYPFGYGLSYTKFKYSDLKVDYSKDINLSFKVKNIGNFKGKEISEAYISLLDAPCRVPIRDLVDFTKIDLDINEEKEVSLSVPSNRLSYVNMDGKKITYKGRILISVGGSQGDNRSQSLGMNENLTFEMNI